jgi:hypothetical protein
MVQEPDFIWLKKELVSGNTSLLLYQVPINAIKKNKDNLVSNIIKMRFCRCFIHSRKGTQYRYDYRRSYSPYFFKIKLDGKLTYEMKGPGS